jgi:hypothetical protein
MKGCVSRHSWLVAPASSRLFGDERQWMLRRLARSGVGTQGGGERVLL